MFKKITTSIACLVLMVQLSGFSGPVPPQNPPPLGPESTLTIIGPDEYGYSLSDEGPYSFNDISTTGFLLPFSDKNNGVATIPIRSFNFYSQTGLDTAYVSVNGFISFNEIALTETVKSSVPKPFPTDSKPNAIVAPFWYDLNLEATSAIYLQLVDSVDPDVACTIIQWNNVKAVSRIEYFTFQVILYDSGDIVFNYLPESGTYAGAMAGIEDVDGVAGLNYAIPDLTSGETVVISRPAPGIHFKARPQVSSAYFSDGEAWLSVNVSNTTDSSALSDSYTLSVDLLESDPAATYPWGLTFYDPSCTTVITTLDNLAKNATTQLCMRVTAGGDQVPGYYARFKITLTSQADALRSSIIYLQTAIDTPFAQLYQDSTEGLKLDLNKVTGPASLDVSVPYSGSYMSMNMLRPGHFIFTWVEGSNIKYRLFSQFPGTFGEIKSIPASPENSNNPDLSPAVAGSRDGYTGILYLIELYGTNGAGHTTLNSNVWYALIDGNGNMIDGYPFNLTNNPYDLDLVTGYSTDPGEPTIPQFSDPRIVPVGQNKLGLTWRTNYFPEGSNSLDKIDYVIAMTDGSDFSYWEISGWSDVSRHVSPSTTSLEDGRFIISFVNYTGFSNPWVINYTVINADGSVSIPSTPIIGTNGWMVDLVQLSTGQVLFGWQDIPTKSIKYAILGSTLVSFDIAATGLTYEDYPGHRNYRSAGYPSVTRSLNGTGVITWQDQDWQEQLYYVLLGSDGSYVTPPSLYRRVVSTLPEAQISTNGYGNAPLASESFSLPLLCNNCIPRSKYYFPIVSNQASSP